MKIIMSFRKDCAWLVDYFPFPSQKPRNANKPSNKHVYSYEPTNDLFLENENK